VNAQVGYIPFGRWIGNLSGKKIPVNASLVAALIPLALLIFNFDLLLKMYSFCVATNLLVQMAVYVYTRHGIHGKAPVGFRLPRKIWISIGIVVIPYISVGLLLIVTGMWAAIAWFSMQSLMFSLFGIQLLVDKYINRRKIRMHRIELTNEVERVQDDVER
jgi:hypothetical protein